MPRVGVGKLAKEFAYSPKGKKAAKDYAKKMGKKVSYRKM